jgi:PAS domain S-box-containing protein
VENLKCELIFVLDTNGMITYISPNTEPLGGYILSDIRCKCYIDYIHPEDREMAADHFRRTLVKSVDPIDFRLMMNDGSGYVWVRSFASPTYKNGTLTGCQGVMIDITGLKEREEELIEANRLLEGILDGVSDILAIQNPDHSIIRYNQAGYERLGLSHDEVFGRYCYTSLGRTKPCEVCASDRALKSRTIETVERYVPELGQYYICRSNPILDDSGEVRLFVEQLTDITSHRELEEDLRESNEYLNNLIAHANAPIIVWNPDCIITRFNHAFEDLTGIPADKMVGSNLDVLFPEETRAASMKMIHQSMSGKRLDSVEIPIQDRSGAVRIVLWNSADIMSKDGVMLRSVIAQGTDITEQKRFTRSMEFLTKTAMELAVMTPEEDIFQYIAQMLTELSPEIRSQICSIDETKGELTIRGLIPRQFREAIEDLIGWDCVGETISLIDTTIPLYEGLYCEMIGTGVREYHFTRDQSGEGVPLYDFCCRTVPEEVCAEFLQSQNIDRLSAVSLVSNGQLYGSVNFYLSPGEELPYFEVIELFLRKVSFFLGKKRSDLEQHQSERRLQEVIATLPMAAAIIGRDGRYLFVNLMFTRLFGYTLDDISSGRDWFRLAFPDEKVRLEVIKAWKEDQASSAEGSVRPRTFHVRCRNGDDRLVFFRPISLNDGSEFVIYEDVTEDRKIYDLLIGEIAGLREKR